MKRILLCCLVVIFMITAPVTAGQFYGGKGYLHTVSALTLPPGALDMSLFARGYTSSIDEEFISNGTSALAANFGFTRRVELSFVQILYQDLNATNRAEGEVTVAIPGDSYVRFKISGYPLSSNMFLGVIPGLRLRVSKYHDVQLEPYESEGVELELTGLMSYYQKPLYPDEGLSVHLNLGYINHNDGETPIDAAQSLTYLVGFMLPRPGIMDYGFEMYGSYFLKQPPESIFGRENWLYVTPMVRYKLFKGLFFTMGLDVLVIGHDEETTVLNNRLEDYANYSTWRITGRVNFTPSTAFYVAPTFAKTDDPGTGRERRRSLRAGTASTETASGGELFNRQELFRWAIEERFGGTEAVDVDLERIRQERIRAEEELRRLRQELENRE